MKTILTIIFLLSFNSNVIAKFYYAQSSVRLSNVEYEYKLNQFDSGNDFVASKVQTVGVGRGSELKHYFSANGNYLVAYLSKHWKVDDEIVIYSTSNFEEVRRLKIGKFFQVKDEKGYITIPPPVFTNDGKTLLVQIKEKKNKSRVDSYDLVSGKVTYSIQVEKGYQLSKQSTRGNLLFVINKSFEGISYINIHSVKNGKLLNSFEKTRSYKEGRVYFSFLENNEYTSIIMIRKNQAIYKYHLLVLDTLTGQVSEKYDLGGAKPVLLKNSGDSFVYITYVKKKKLYISKFENGLLKDIVVHQESFVPKYLIADKKRDMFVVASSKHLLLLNAKGVTSVTKIKTPFDVASGFFSSDNRFVYLREGNGSEVAIVDFEKSDLVERSGTGRRSVKIGNFLIASTLGIMAAYYTGNYGLIVGSDTMMLLERKENKLFVINRGTNDVTIFDSKNLSGKRVEGTGSDTFGVFQLNKNNLSNENSSNIFVISNASITYFANNEANVIKIIKYKEFLSVDFDENLLFVRGGSGYMEIYQLDAGKLIKKAKMSRSLHKVFHNLDQA